MENFHGRIEDEFYDLEELPTLPDLLTKAFTYIAEEDNPPLPPPPLLGLFRKLWHTSYEGRGRRNVCSSLASSIIQVVRQIGWKTDVTDTYRG